MTGPPREGVKSGPSQGGRKSTVVDRFVAAATIDLAALFPAYLEDGPALADSAPNVWFNAPPIAAWFVAGLLLLARRTQAWGAAMGIACTTVWWSTYLPTFAVGGDEIGPGYVLALVALAVAIAASLLAVVPLRAGLSDSWTKGRAWVVLAVATAGVAYSVGTAMPWVKTTLRLTDGDTWVVTGTEVRSESCCTVLDFQGWDLAESIVLLILAVVVPTGLVILLGAPRATAGLIGAAAALIAHPLFALADLGVALDPEDFADTPANAADLLVTDRALPGLWLAFAAALSLIAIAVAIEVGRAVSRASMLPPAPVASTMVR